jgi:hypothetical protein
MLLPAAACEYLEHVTLPLQSDTERKEQHLTFHAALVHLVDHDVRVCRHRGMLSGWGRE